MKKMLETIRSSLLVTLICLLCSSSPTAGQLSRPYLDRFAILANTVLQSQSNKGASGPAAQVLEMIGAFQKLPADVVQQAILQTVSSQQRNLLAANVDASENYELCLNHTMEIISGVRARQAWATQMIDAMGKPLPGITEGNLIWPGAYEQCLKVQAFINASSGSNETAPLFSGRYCTATAMLSSVVGASPLTATLSIGLCMPDSCSSESVTLILTEVVAVLNISLPNSPSALCQDPGWKPLETKTIVAIVVCSCILFLMIAGTAADILYIQMPKWRLKKVSSVSANSFITSFNGYVSKADERHPLLEKPDVTAVEIPEPGICIKLLATFSVYTNGAKMLSTEQASGSLTCIHGIRFFSMTWVVLGHALTANMGQGENLTSYFSDILGRWTYQAICNAFVSVDSFFLLSGLLVAYLSLKEMKKNNGKINWFLFYFHRFWRLTPALMLVIMVYTCFYPYMGSGPFWTNQSADSDNCEDNWWTNLLYVNNLVNEEKMCLGVSWYLANDMQFYILSPLIFVPFYYKPLLGAVSAGLFLIATTVTPAVLTAIKHFPPSFLVQLNGDEANTTDYMIHYYIKPWNRMGPYIVGLLAGYFLYRCNCTLRLNKVVNLAIWAVAAAFACGVVYGLYEATDNQGTMELATSAVYNAVHRTVWGACLAWVIIACVTGNGGFVNSLLSWSAFVPLSRLTYCIYLVHIEILAIYALNAQSVFYFNDVNLVMFFLAMLVVSYVVGFVVSLAFEAPMLGLEKILIRRK